MHETSLTVLAAIEGLRSRQADAVPVIVTERGPVFPCAAMFASQPNPTIRWYGHKGPLDCTGQENVLG